MPVLRGTQPPQALCPHSDLQGLRFLYDGLCPEGHERLVVLLFLIVVLVGCCFLGEEQHQDGGLEEQSIREVFHLL